MDTLVIVRKIREAESLADSGKHLDAKQLLEPLLSQDALTDSHRKLVSKKLELFDRQQQRMTRIISRRATSVRSNDETNPESDASSAQTAIRKPIEDSDKSERPTDLTIEKEVRGQPTEVVPRARDIDTEVPETGHKLKSTKGVSQGSGSWPAVDTDRREVVRPPDPSDSQELAPVAESDRLDSVEDKSGEDPRKTDMFTTPSEPEQVSDSLIKVDGEEESAPEISRFKTGSRIYTSRNDTPAPGWNDTPVPQMNTPIPPSVRDSIVVSDEDEKTSRDHSTYMMADDYFTSRASARRKERSNPELKALADRLPDDDLRRELALEVVKLREKLEQAEGESTRREATRAGSRKIKREDRPESGSFHIPASQVNTIVRRAAGTDDIEVHMPGRDDDASELQVLRRDSVRGKKVNPQPTDRIALAQDYIDASQVERPSLLKPLATLLGIAVVISAIGWAIYLGYQSVSGSGGGVIEMSENSVGEYRLGEPMNAYAELKPLRNDAGPVIQYDDQGWIFQYDESSSGRDITAITVPGPDFSADAKSQFRRIVLEFGNSTLNFADPAVENPVSIEQVIAKLGEPQRDFNAKAFEESGAYTMEYVSQSGARTLEFHYVFARKDRPEWVRIVDAAVSPAPINLSDFRSEDARD